MSDECADLEALVEFRFGGDSKTWSLLLLRGRTFSTINLVLRGSRENVDAGLSAELLYVAFRQDRPPVQYAPSFLKITLTVLKRITMSLNNDQFLTYQASKFTRLS